MKVEHVERALRQSHGLIHPAAKLLEAAYGSCSPATVRNYLKRHPKLRAAVEETIEFRGSALAARSDAFSPGRVE
jgi:hypothetical protein